MTQSPSSALYLERTGVRQYVASNDRGATVQIGKGPGQFSPGDLLKIALAGCNAMSSDVRMSGALGEGFRQVIGVSATHDDERDSFTSFQVELIQDLSSLSEEDRAAVIRRATGAIERNCTVEHTIADGATTTFSFASEEV